MTGHISNTYLLVDKVLFQYICLNILDGIHKIAKWIKLIELNFFLLFI